MIDFIACVFIRGLNILFSVVPVDFTLWVGRRLGIVAFWFNKSRRPVAYANLKAAFANEKSPREIRAITKRVYQNMAQTFVEVLNLTKVNKKYYDRYIEIINEDRLRAASVSGRGTILLTAHFGDWELSSLVSSVIGLPILVLVREQKMKRLNELLNRLRESNGCKVIRKGMDVKNLIRALRDKNIVGILADQDAGKAGMFVDFFGRPTSSHSGTMQIAKHTDSIVLPNFIVRTHGPYHKLYIEEAIDFRQTDSPNDIRENLQKYMSVLEKYVRQYPDQWLWLHKRWKSTPLRTVLVLSDGKAGHLNQSLSVARQIQKVRFEQGFKESDTKIVVVEVKYKSKAARTALAIAAKFATWRCHGLMGPLRACLQKDSYETLMKTYSDFVVSCGSQAAPVNVYMAKENNAKNIIIMKPDIIGLRQFSLAIIPKHDRPPDRGNVVPTVLAPNLIDRENMRSYGAMLGQKIRIDKDIVLGALIGGDNPDFAMTRDMANKAISGLIEFCKTYDADLLLTTSRRTPKEVEALIKERLGKYNFCKLMVIANEKNIEGAVAGILGLSSIVAVSGESVSMVSEAINSGKKVVIFDLEKKNKGITKYERVLDSLEREGYVNCAHPSDLGTRLSKVWKTVRAIKAVDDRHDITEAIKKLL
ncbi:MAG: mitochondrial fission ELM1 family protein [Candidatus Omnitrophica bacterium]|nr:mitochondrial fission ELM1 family protein [Candidatus Omnitrophota bacterium]